MPEISTPTTPLEASENKTGYIALATGVVGTSTSSLLYKLSYATGLHPLWVNVMRMFLVLLMMAPMTFLNPKKRSALLHIPKSGFWLSALAGTILSLHFSAWALALENTDVFAASAISGTYLLMTALFSALILKEKTSRAALVGMVIATIGVVVCNLDGGMGKLAGNIAALLAAMLQALYTLCGRKARDYMDTNTYTSVMYGFTFVWMAIFVGIFGIPSTGLGLQSLVWGIGLAVLCTLLGHTMLNVSLKYFKAPTVSAVMMLSVILSPMVVFAVLGDLPTKNTFIGGCVIIVGLVWYLWMERKEAVAQAASRMITAQREMDASAPEV